MVAQQGVMLPAEPDPLVKVLQQAEKLHAEPCFVVLVSQ